MGHKLAIISCKCQEIVVNLLLTDRCLETCRSTERARIRPAESPLIWVFIDMRSIWIILPRVGLEPAFRSLGSLARLSLEGDVVVWTIVRAPRCLLLIVTQGGKGLVRSKPFGLVSVWAPRGGCLTAGSYIFHR